MPMERLTNLIRNKRPQSLTVGLLVPRESSRNTFCLLDQKSEIFYNARFPMARASLYLPCGSFVLRNTPGSFRISPCSLDSQSLFASITFLELYFPAARSLHIFLKLPAQTMALSGQSSRLAHETLIQVKTHQPITSNDIF
jgi:hypothetical protein